MPEVLSREGLPIVSDFAQGKGTPLVVNVDTGRGYVLRDDNTIVPLNGGGGYFYERDYETLQACIDAAVAARVGTIVLEPGIHTISTGLVQAPASGQTHINWIGLGGAGLNGVILNYTGTGGTALTIKNNTRYTFENIRIINGGTGTRGLFLTSNTVGSNHGPANYINVFVSGFDTNVQIGDTDNKAASEILFINLETSSADVGLLVQGPASGTSFSTNIRFIALQATLCGDVIVVAGDNEGTQIKLTVWGFSCSFNDREFDFQVPGMYDISSGYTESDTDGQLFRSGSSDPTANSAYVTNLSIRSVITNYPSTPSNFVALAYQPGHYLIEQSTLQTGRIELGGFDGGAGPRKSTIEVKSTTIARSGNPIVYKAASNTIWSVTYRQNGNTNTEAVNQDEDREYIIDTSGNELTLTKYGAWSASAGGDALAATLGIRVVATASLPAASSDMNGSVIIEDAGAGDRNIIIYAGSQRFRIDGGAAF
jgi:hypothetical protein